MSISSHFKTIAAAAAIVMIPGTGWAQLQLEEIIVTATRREASLQSVPISVTALTAERMQAARIDGLPELALQTSGININARSVAWAPTIRGIGTLDISASQESAVASYVDGVYLSNAFGANIPFNNLERVEILKGPQGTLFGRNTTGGVIHAITRDPGEETTIKATVGYGNYQRFAGQLYAGGSLSDTLAADLSIYYVDQNDSFGDVITTGEEIPPPAEAAVRTKWVWSPADTTKVTFSADYSKREGVQGDPKNFVKGSYGADTVTTTTGDFQDVLGEFPLEREIELWGASLRLEHQFSGFDFLSITAYREVENIGLYDNDSTALPLVGVDIIMEVDTFTQEFQILSQSEGFFEWIAGVFYMDDTNGWAPPTGIRLYGIPFPDPVTGNPASLSSVNDTTTESISVFAEGTLNFTDHTRVTLGARYTKDEKELSGELIPYFEDGSIAGRVPFPTPKEKFDEPTWRAVYSHDVGEDAMLYASYNRGFRSGTYQSVFPNGVAVEPEIVDALEIGAKSTVLDGRLQLNAALFYSDYQDLQVIIALGPAQLLVNAAEAEIFGAEVEATFVATDQLQLNFAITYLDTEYKEFLEAPCTGRSPTGATVGITCNSAGNNLARTPEWSFNIGGRYEVPTQGGPVGLTLNYWWTDDFNWQPDGRLVEESYGLLSGNLYWTSADDRYTVRLWGKNITDEEYSAFTVPQPGLGDTYAPANPRQFGVELEVNF